MNDYLYWIIGIGTCITAIFEWYGFNVKAKKYGCISISSGIFPVYICSIYTHPKRFKFFLLFFNILFPLLCGISLYFPIWVQDRM